MHSRVETGHVALDSTAHQLHEVDDDEFRQPSIPQVDERVQGIDGHVDVLSVKDGPGDDIGHLSEFLLRGLVGLVLVGVQEIFRNFERQLETLDLSSLVILLLIS